MAANEVIDLDSSDSSDDEMEITTAPPPPPPPKINGAINHTTIDDDDDDDLEILEVKTDIRPRPHTTTTLIPPSSSRSQIRKIIRGTTHTKSVGEEGRTNGTSNVTHGGGEEGGGERSNGTSSNVTHGGDEGGGGGERSNGPCSNGTSSVTVTRTSPDTPTDTKETTESEASKTTLENFIWRWKEVKMSKDDDKIQDKLWKYYHLAHTTLILTQG
ncbi:hypothetical protein Pcinc_037998 [Petrolisthes cinctipes]|uniref:Uncharacterized protein n=1 Tax=Petrolisthes cinctipes TaxID=88211 RepID=A0AAE1EKG7_PETCI|nr:hypothetical protein Pcinc_037998 [Petrolisthes cinctipes]